MASRFAHLDETALQALDRVFEAEHQARWQPFYDERGRACPFFADAPDEHLVEAVTAGEVAPGRALDLGCGHGRNALWLARQGFEVDALDLSASAVAWARERVGGAVRLHQGSVFDWPQPEACADLVVDSGLFHHLAPHRRAGYVARVARWLKPGGLLVMSCFRPEGGSGLDDDEAYAQGRLGGGFGFEEAALRALWAPPLAIVQLRPMHEHAVDAACFGRSFLWALKARRPFSAGPA